MNGQRAVSGSDLSVPDEPRRGVAASNWVVFAVQHRKVQHPSAWVVHGVHRTAVDVDRERVAWAKVGNRGLADGWSR